MLRSPVLRLSLFFATTILVATSCGPSGLSESALRGREVFTSAKAKCAQCHALLHAGATARLGPDLDIMRPKRERTILAVTDGRGVFMPPQKGLLTELQIADVAEYLAEVAGQ